jgi:hypothetical protein
LIRETFKLDMGMPQSTKEEEEEQEEEMEEEEEEVLISCPPHPPPIHADAGKVQPGVVHAAKAATQDEASQGQ